MPSILATPPASAFANENAALKTLVGQLEGELAVLRAQITWLKKQLFGSKSERVDQKQMLLKLGELEELATRFEEAKRRQVAAHERATLPREKHPLPADTLAKLPVKETLVIEPEEVKANPQAYERISEEKTFEVDVIPPVLFKREIIRPKYRHKADAQRPPLLAPAPKRPVEGGHASAGLLAYVAVSKYADHLPLHRLEQIFQRWGARIPRQSMAEWIAATAQWLEPIHKRMRETLLAGDYLQADETPVKYLDPQAPGGAAQQGYLWVIHRPGGEVVFEWRLTRCHDELKHLIGENHTGLLQSDAYGAYTSYAREREEARKRACKCEGECQCPKLTWLGCWAHARRKFHEAQTTHPRAARAALRLIGRLYAWERHWNETEIHDPPRRALLRQTHFARHLKWLRTLAQHWRATALPKSPLGTASAYLLDHWQPLCAHLSHGQTRLDTNAIENAIRPCALGRKNWLFIGHPDAGQRSAILYSIIASLRRHGKDAHAYLRDVLTRLPAMTTRDDLDALLPSRWQPPCATGDPASRDN